MNLTQQLEDKKKGCFRYTNRKSQNAVGQSFLCGVIGNQTNGCNPFLIGKLIYCPKCKEMIAILEQAIAEIKCKEDKIFELECKYKRAMEGWVDNANLLQKQRQDFIDKLEGEWISNRIISEHKKYKLLPNNEWARIAQSKIRGTLKQQLTELKVESKQ